MGTTNGRMLSSILAAAGFSIFAIGCQEPGYRNEVSNNAQGAVEVHRVPKDATPTPAVQDPPPSTAGAGQTTEQRLAALEAQVLELKAEVSRLNTVHNQTPTNP